MGRRRTIHLDLPRKLHKRGRSYYFVTTDRGARLWLRLGDDKAKAIEMAHELRRTPKAIGNLRTEVFARDKFSCVYCGATEALELDHFIPTSRGGANSIGNLVVACRTCNSSKNARNPLEFLRERLGL